jgi:hypothetical protein
MPVRADETLRRVTINLYDADCTTFADHYGHGWSTEVRAIIHSHANLIRASVPQRQTLGDLDDYQT